MPKSSIFTWPSGVMRMFRGLMSPWTIPVVLMAVDLGRKRVR